MAFRHQNHGILEKSSSGGAFAAVVSGFWDEHQDGVVFGAAFDDSFQVKHVDVTKKQGMSRFHGSKYVQSDLNNAYEQIARLLDGNQAVLFSGTPCQCAAVRRLFGKNELLLLVDVVCNGVASPAAFCKYLKSHSDEQGAKAVSYSFRNKRYEKGRGMACTFENGSVIEQTHGKDRFCKLYMTNMISRLSCYRCQFTTTERDSDLTLGDFHGLSELDPEFAEDGVSLVIAHTEKGREYAQYLQKLGKWKTYPVEKSLQPRLKTPPPIPMLRRFILKDFLTLPDELFEKKYGKMI